MHMTGIADGIIGSCPDGLPCGSAASTPIPRPGSDGHPCPPSAQHPHVCGPAAQAPAAPALRGLPQVHRGPAGRLLHHQQVGPDAQK